MSLLSLKLFGHCADDGEDAIASDFTDENEIEMCGVNEATGLPLVPSCLKGCSDTIDVEGNPRGTDLSDFCDLSSSNDDCSIDNTLNCGMDIHSDIDWISDGSSLDSCIGDFGCSDLAGIDSDR